MSKNLKQLKKEKRNLKNKINSLKISTTKYAYNGELKDTLDFLNSLLKKNKKKMLKLKKNESFKTNKKDIVAAPAEYSSCGYNYGSCG